MPAKIKYPVIDGKKECGGCGKFLPISEFKPARTHLTSKCVSCLKEYAKEYRQRPDVKEKNNKYYKEYIKDPEKRAHRNAYNRKWNKQSHARESRNSQRRAWALKQKLLCIEYKGGKCVACGFDRYTASLDFHHLDPSEKEGLNQHNSFENRKEELDKCVLLCSNCHRAVHSGELTL